MVGFEERCYLAVGIFLYSLNNWYLYIAFIRVTSLSYTWDWGRVIGYKRIKVGVWSSPRSCSSVNWMPVVGMKRQQPDLEGERIGLKLGGRQTGNEGQSLVPGLHSRLLWAWRPQRRNGECYVHTDRVVRGSDCEFTGPKVEHLRSMQVILMQLVSNTSWSSGKSTHMNLGLVSK